MSEPNDEDRQVARGIVGDDPDEDDVRLAATLDIAAYRERVEAATRAEAVAEYEARLRAYTDSARGDVYMELQAAHARIAELQTPEAVLSAATRLLREAGVDAMRDGVHVDPSFTGVRLWREFDQGRVGYADGATMGEAYDKLRGAQ